MPIYAIFDVEDKCLYVGQSIDHPVKRWVAHMRDKPWFMRAVRFEVLRDLTEMAAFSRLNPEFGQRNQAGDEIPIRTVVRIQRVAGDDGYASDPEDHMTEIVEVDDGDVGIRKPLPDWDL